jgi:Ca2+-binding EF-hand superfamily protein
MIKKTIKAGLLIGCIAMLTSCANTQRDSQQSSSQKSETRNKQGKEKPDASELIKKMDSKGDGKLSENEVKGPLADDFSKVDANRDGYITKEELEKAPRPSRQGRPRR